METKESLRQRPRRDPEAGISENRLFDSDNSNTNGRNSAVPPAGEEHMKKNVPRLVERDLPFNQSRNRLKVSHNHSVFKLFLLLRHDWFHWLVRINTYKSLTSLLVVWTLSLIEINFVIKEERITSG